MTLTVEFDTESVKMNHLVKYLGQRSFRLKVTVCIVAVDLAVNWISVLFMSRVQIQLLPFLTILKNIFGMSYLSYPNMYCSLHKVNGVLHNIL